MTIIMKHLKRIIASASFERISVAISICYAVGITLLLLYNSIYEGDIDFDFVRIKPILVGLEYFIYLGLPIVVVLLPVILTSKKCFDWFWTWFYCRNKKGSKWLRIWGLLLHVLIYVVEVVLFAFLSGLMLHYFLPYTEYYLPNGERFPDDSLFSMIMISCSFWRVYSLRWICLVAFLALFAGAFLWTLMYCNYISIRRPGIRRFYSIAVLILAPTGFITNMLFFLTNVYPNISQAACGGAPVNGIITIESPSEQLRKNADGFISECSENTKFCNVMQVTDGFWYIEELFLEDLQMKGVYTLRSKPTRIRNADIKQFTPLNVPIFFHDGERHTFHQSAWKDFVHNVDVHAYFTFSVLPKHGKESLYSFNTTNTIEMSWQADNLPTSRSVATRQRVMKDNQTNLYYSVEFRHVPIPIAMTVPEFMFAVTNCNNSFNCIISNLPETSSDIKLVSYSCNLILNYNLVFRMNQDKRVVPGYDRIITLYNYNSNNCEYIESDYDVNGRSVERVGESDKTSIGTRSQ